MPSWLDHPRSPDEGDENDDDARRPGSSPPGADLPDPDSAPAEGHYANGSAEFHGAGAVPEGFGFRTGMRSARTVLGFAWFVLAMATLLLLMGAIIFIGQSAWIPVIVLCLLEAGFITVFIVLRNLARQRRNQPD
ncbi:hypothetical protein [Arthrobacter sp. JSM 101049]|uniref:hypothetical protein n=1 Tax=Arthrobacter sp. JSM 101049 TaxID=929097 RepID=UPI0035644992